MSGVAGHESGGLRVQARRSAYWLHPVEFGLPTGSNLHASRFVAGAVQIELRERIGATYGLEPMLLR